MSAKYKLALYTVANNKKKLLLRHYTSHPKAEILGMGTIGMIGQEGILGNRNCIHAAQKQYRREENVSFTNY